MNKIKNVSHNWVRPKVIAIVGPTGSGKTGLAVKLIKKFGGIVISADSRQIYKGMTIGTAKPTKLEQHQAKHYLIDLIKPSQQYSAFKFQQETYKLVKYNCKQPIFLVGGTYQYVDAVLKGWDFSKTKADRALRKKLNNLSLLELQHRLKKSDPATYAKIDRKNRRRLVRALEVVAQTGKSFYDQRKANPPDWDVLKIGLTVPRKKLDQQNRKRIDKMFSSGWAKEVKYLSKKYPRSASGFFAHGYREVYDYVKGKVSLKNTKERIAINTRHHAKRQVTWFKKDPKIIWIKPTSVNTAKKLVKKFLG